MQAVILAGGLGTRLRPVTERISKVMVNVGGKPFLQHVLELLKSQGIRDAVLCTGYLGEQVSACFGQGKHLDMAIAYSQETGMLLGTGGALKQAQALLEDHFLVLNGDTYLPVDYCEVERSFLRRGKTGLMVVRENSADTGIPGNVQVGGDSMVKRHDKRAGDPGLKYLDAGAIILKREVLDLVKSGCAISLEEGLYPALIRRNELAAHITTQRYYDIGTPDRIMVFDDYLRGKSR